jgi:hypothetical protein
VTEPTPQDIENAERRAGIAAKFRAEYALAEALAISVFGPGWKPTGRYYLVEKDEEDRCRHTGEKPKPAATVISVENGKGEKRYFRADGTPRACASKEDGFGEMMLEKHPTKTFTVKGVEYPIHRYSLCWGWFEPSYRPASAEKLADMRAKREEKAVAKEAEGNLFADMIREEGYVKPRRKGKPR